MFANCYTPITLHWFKLLQNKYYLKNWTIFIQNLVFVWVILLVLVTVTVNLNSTASPSWMWSAARRRTDDWDFHGQTDCASSRRPMTGEWLLSYLLSSEDDGHIYIICTILLRWLIPALPLFFALAFHIQLEYRCTNARINSGDDPATSGINLVGFCPVTLKFACLTVYNRRRSALGLVHLRSLGDTVRHRVDQYTILFHC